MENNNNIKTISWDEFSEYFSNIAGGKNINKNNLDRYVEKKILPQKWTPVFDWESYEDVNLLRRLAQELFFENGVNLIITFVSYEKSCGPFVVKAEETETFIKNYHNNYKEAFFSGTDVLIINITKKIVFVFNHESYYTIVNLTNWERIS